MGAGWIQLGEEKDLNDPTGDKVLSSETTFHVPTKYGNPMKSGLTADV